MKMKQSVIFNVVVLVICMITVHAYVEQVCAYNSQNVVVVNGTPYTASITVTSNALPGGTTLAPGGSWDYGSMISKFIRLEGKLSNPPWGDLKIVPRCVGGNGEGENAQCPEVDKGTTSWKIQLDPTSNTYRFIKQ